MDMDVLAANDMARLVAIHKSRRQQRQQGWTLNPNRLMHKLRRDAEAAASDTATAKDVRRMQKMVESPKKRLQAQKILERTSEARDEGRAPSPLPPSFLSTSQAGADQV